MKLLSILMLLVSMAVVGCTKKRAELGTKENPVKFYFVPSVDAKMLEGSGKLIEKYLEENTPYQFEFAVPASYVAVVEAFGADRADVAALNTFGYMMANKKYGAEAKLTFIRFGKPDYQAQIIARADSSIKTVADIDGKKFAYVDPISFSGYLMPARLFKSKNIKPSETIYANKHDNVVTMVYQGQVDAGATFYTPPQPDGKIEDARRLVLKQYPDVVEKVKIIELTEPIPNDPLTSRKTMPEPMKELIIEAFLKYKDTDEGKKVLHDLYGITDMVRSDDTQYKAAWEMIATLGIEIEALKK